MYFFNALLDTPHLFRRGVSLLGIIYEGESLGEAFGFQVGELLPHGIKCLKLKAHIDDLMLFGQQ